MFIIKIKYKDNYKMPTFVEPPESSGGSGYSEGRRKLSFGTITATSKVSLPDGTNTEPSFNQYSEHKYRYLFPRGRYCDNLQVAHKSRCSWSYQRNWKDYR